MYSCILAGQRGSLAKGFCVFAKLGDGTGDGIGDWAKVGASESGGHERTAAMDWDDMRIFLAVARADSLSGAGRRLGIDASTVGRRVANGSVSSYAGRDAL